MHQRLYFSETKNAIKILTCVKLMITLKMFQYNKLDTMYYMYGLLDANT